MNALPPLARIEAGLRTATERFAAELACAQTLPPVWSELEWFLARAATVLQGVTPLLAERLRWSGPPGWREFLDQQRRHTALRHRRIETLLAHIDTEAARVGIGVVGLKGTALHRLGLYTGGDRPMADIDLLARTADLERTRRLLATLGYRERCAIWKHWVFEPAQRDGALHSEIGDGFGEHADGLIKIELHCRVIERLPVRGVDISERLWPASDAVGLCDYPAMDALLLHLLLHAAGNMVGRNLRLIQLHDIAALAARLRPADWDALLRWHGRRAAWWALPPLRLVARYYREAIPPEVLAALRPACPRWLRWSTQRQRISDVSYADARFRALPGLPWSTPPRECLQYVRSRLRPGREQQALWDFLSAEPWAARSEWPRMSAGRRIAHWALTRPARPATMHAVQAAWMHRAAAGGDPDRAACAS
jgi:hypothetical protein